MFQLCTLFDPTLDFLDVSMTVVLHLTHSPMLLHIQMIVSNFPQSPQAHRYWCFLPPLSLPLVHNNLEMQNWYTNLDCTFPLISFLRLVTDFGLEVSNG
jgi:hypothetical protein